MEVKDKLALWSKDSLGSDYESKGLIALENPSKYLPISFYNPSSSTFFIVYLQPRIQDGTVFAALVNKFHPDALDFDVVIKVSHCYTFFSVIVSFSSDRFVALFRFLSYFYCFSLHFPLFLLLHPIMQQEKSARMETVFSVAETRWKVPKLLEEAWLSDERVCAMYLGLLSLAFTSSEKVYLGFYFIHDINYVSQWDAFLQRVNSTEPSALDPVASPALSRANQPEMVLPPSMKGIKLPATTNAAPVSRAPSKMSSSKYVKSYACWL
jgi:hypothetical protein